MKRVCRHANLLPACLAWLLPLLAASAPEVRSQGIIAQLLDMPVRLPAWAGHRGPPTSEVLENGVLAGDPYAVKTVIGYWAYPAHYPHKETPNEAQARLLLAAVKQWPWHLPEVIELLPAEPRTYEIVKDLIEREGSESSFRNAWRAEARRWLMLRSEFFRDELLEAARTATDITDSVKNKEALSTLARLDWTAARPILEFHRSSTQTRIATLSRTLLMKHAYRAGNWEEAARLRTELIAIAENRETPGYARKLSIEALMASSWVGQVDWYVSLLKDNSLQETPAPHYLKAALAAPVSEDPDNWVPRLTPLVGHTNRTVHDAAVELLAEFCHDRTRADALRPLLPWLEDHRWSSALGRVPMIQSLHRAGLTEAIPGLIHVVEKEWGSSRNVAATELGRFRATDAVPALRAALRRAETAGDRASLLIGLLGCDGFTAEEMALEIENFAAQIASPEGLEAYREATYGKFNEYSLNIAFTTGGYISGYLASMSSEGESPPSELAALLLNRIEQLAGEDEQQAGSLRRIISQWASPMVDEYLITGLAAGKIDAECIAALLKRRISVRSHAAGLLQPIVEKGGIAAGVAAVLLADTRIEETILKGRDSRARKALLASARLVRETLDLELVEALLASTEAELALVAERYLIADDGPAARRVVLAHHHGKARILGFREGIDPERSRFPQFDARETKLRREVLRAHGPDEIYAFLIANSEEYIVRVRNGRARLKGRDVSGRSFRRALTPAEFNHLKTFIDDRGVDDLGPLNASGDYNTEYEYLHLTRDGGRRVFMINPGLGGSAGSVYDLLVHLFLEFADHKERLTSIDLGRAVFLDVFPLNLPELSRIRPRHGAHPLEFEMSL